LRIKRRRQPKWFAVQDAPVAPLFNFIDQLIS
jgi:hypothetical protein